MPEPTAADAADADAAAGRAGVPPAPPATLRCDVAIVGAGPAGLCLAQALRGSGLDVVLVEQQPGAALADPAFDGREIALTLRSRRLLEGLGVWRRLPADALHPLREARVEDAGASAPLRLRPPAGQPMLGTLVPNHLLRRAAWEAVHAGAPAARVLAGARVVAARVADGHGALALEDGRRIEARLRVAADSRVSGLRRLLGLGAASRDFAKTMLTVRVRHPGDHEGIARERFGIGQTLALLPLSPGLSSAVLTLAPAAMDALLALDDAALGAELTRRSEGVLGPLQVASSRHAWPLVGVYADDFAGPRLALVGDAAVGMHPVTAHGFNFGLAGVDALAARLRDGAAAVGAGFDPGDAALLRGWARRHRRATRPLYLATAAVVGAWTDDRRPARVLRAAALGLAARLPGLGGLMARGLMDRG